MSNMETGGGSASTPSKPIPAVQATPLVQGIAPPKPLDTTRNIVDNWKQFKRMWNNYIFTNLNAQTEDYRVALFLHCLGPDTLTI